jgi:RimJ/RimL family protein N-acetyltransferase
MINLESERLILRNYKETDFQDFYEYMQLEYTARHDDFEPLNFEQCTRLLSKRLNNDNYLVVELRDAQKVIGDVSFDAEEFESFSISYDFNVKFEKQGFATEACRVLIRYIFEMLNGRRIFAECNEDNVNSYKLLERLGFRQEGHFLEDVTFKNDAEGNPIYVNSYLYAILKSEWVAMCSK